MAEARRTVEFTAKFDVQVDKEVPRAHQQSLCKIVTVAAACHVDTEADTKWDKFSAYLAVALYTECRNRHYKPENKIYIEMTKRTNTAIIAGSPRVLYQIARARVLVKIEDQQYTVDYGVQLWFDPSEDVSSDDEDQKIELDRMLYKPHQSFFDLVKSAQSSIHHQHRGSPEKYVQALVNRLADEPVVQPVLKVQPIPPEHRKVMVKMSVRIIAPKGCKVPPEDRHTVAQRIALFAATHLEYKIQPRWIDFKAICAWELYLKLQTLSFDISMKNPSCVLLHYEAPEVNRSALPMKVVLNLEADFLLRVKKKTYALLYEIVCGYYANETLSEDDVPLANDTPLTQVHEPPPAFRELIHEINRYEEIYIKFNNLMFKDLTDMVNGKCIKPVKFTPESAPDYWAMEAAVVKISACIKSRKSNFSLVKHKERDAAIQTIAIMMGMLLDEESRTQWNDFTLYASWQLYLKLTLVEYKPKKRYTVELQYEAGNIPPEAMEKSFSGLSFANFEIQSQNKLYEFFYDVTYGYYPKSIQEPASDIPFSENVPFTELTEPPSQFRKLVNEINRYRHLRTRDSSFNIVDMTGYVYQTCLLAISAKK